MDKVKIGQFIYQLRCENNLTQEKLACILNIPLFYEKLIEKGYFIINKNLFNDLCIIFKINVDELIIGHKKLTKEEQKQALFIALDHYRFINKVDTIICYLECIGFIGFLIWLIVLMIK